MIGTNPWTRIRALRASPPALAKDDALRREVFSAALQQSEELFGAAASVGPASKPLPLFYGLSQAGRAISAAFNDSDDWQIVGHGLTVRADTADIRGSVVTAKPKSDRSDAYASVAHAVGSPPLAGSLSLAALWGALPELYDLAHFRGDALPAVEIRPDEPHPLLHASVEPASGSIVLLDVEGQADVQQRLAQYGGTDGCEVLPGTMTIGRATHVGLRWPGEPSSAATQGTKAIRAMADVALHVDGRWFLQPLLGAPGRAVTHLLTWWPLVIALSSLARYHPSVWTRALDVDREKTAVELEQCLLTAERRIPLLIGQALTRPATRASL